MRRPLLAALLWVCLLGSSTRLHAFSMLGPFDAWMTTEIGYNLPITVSAREGDAGGPMNLGEEYRWNSPVITYAYDRSFEDYFGTKGIEAVEAAVKILNDLPRVSAMSADLSEFPLNVSRINNRAAELRIIDLKTTVLSILLEHLGLASPERYAWTLRNRTPTAVPDIFFYNVVQRNFDPITFEPTAYVNGTRYTYRILRYTAPLDYSEANEIELDPALPNSSVVGISGMQAGNNLGLTRVLRTFYSMGLYVNGLTRDDVGGLRYLYHPENVNVETVPSDAIGGSAGGFAAGGTTTQDNSPWGLPGGVFSSLTNAAAGGGAGTAATNSTFVYVAPRPGVDKVVFRRIPRNSSASNQVFIVRYNENIIQEVNGVIGHTQQSVTRVIQTPDILFTAADLGVVGAFSYPYARLPQFSNNSQLHSASADATAGPGTIGPGVADGGAITTFPQMEIALSKVGPWNFHIGNTSEEDRLTGFDVSSGFVWGIFDGSTNAPVLFPSGTSIKDMERRIFGRR